MKTFLIANSAETNKPKEYGELHDDAPELHESPERSLFDLEEETGDF